MTNYIPHHSKKRERREHLESVLGRILRAGGPPDDVERAAEAVRQAKIREYASHRAQLPAKEEFAAKLAEIDARLARWTAMPLEAIVDFYRRRSGDI